MPPAAVRQTTEELLADLHLSFAEADRQVALDYLTAIPPVLACTLGRSAHSLRRTALTDRGPETPDRAVATCSHPERQTGRWGRPRTANAGPAGGEGGQ